MKDGSTPATKADITRLDANMTRLDGRMDKLDGRMDKLDASIHHLATEMHEMAKGLHAAINQVLTVLVNVDKRLTASIDNHERRIIRLEDHVGIAA